MLTKEQMDGLPGLVAQLNAADLDEENNNELCWKAADALEDIAATVIEQQAEIERLRGALGKHAPSFETEAPCRHEWYQGQCVHCETNVKDFRTRAALTPDRAATNALGNIAHAVKDQEQ